MMTWLAISTEAGAAESTHRSKAARKAAELEMQASFTQHSKSHHLKDRDPAHAAIPAEKDCHT